MGHLVNGLSRRTSGARLAGALLLALGLAFVANAATPRAACACTPKAKAYLASMKADLRNLISAQEEFFADSGRFAASLSELDSVRYRLSYGNELVSLKARADGFDARVSHPSGISQQCWISATIGADGLLNLAEPQCDPWPSDLFPAPLLYSGIVYTVATYAALWLLALVVRIRRAGSSLPPLRRRTTVGFLSLAVIHPYWLFDRSIDSCNGMAPMLQMLWLPMMALIAVWMLVRGRRASSVVLLAVAMAVVANAATPRALHARINKTGAYVAAMKADLRNLVTAQESFLADSGRYAASLEELTPDRYMFSTGVELVTLSARADGFSARVSYPGGTERECWMDFGPLPDGTANEHDGEPVCTLPPIDEGRVYLAGAYALLLLFALGMRLARGGITLPPMGVPFVAVFILFAAVHPFWSGYRTESYSCLNTIGPEWLSVCLAAILALRTATREDEDPNPPRPA